MRSPYAKYRNAFPLASAIVIALFLTTTGAVLGKIIGHWIGP